VRRSVVRELAAGLEEDAPEWQVRVARELARRLDFTEPDLRAARAHAAEELEWGACEPSGELEVLLLRGDGPTLELAARDAPDRLGLLAPPAWLRARDDPAELDRELAREAWGGRGPWRRLEALAATDRGRADLRAALERAPARRTPPNVAACVVLARAGEVRPELEAVARGQDVLARWARAALEPQGLADAEGLERLAREGSLEALPPPLVADALARLGARAGVALERAAAEAGGARPRRFLTDLALEAFSTDGPSGR
jgi:hypothetical protein